MRHRMDRAVADIRPLRGVRFDPDTAGAVGPLLAPPYDVASKLVAAPRFAISQIENADLGVVGDAHALAARRYQEWRATGVLRRDSEPAIYIHRHRFVANGVRHVRTALIARVRLADWSERIVLPHEGTMPGPREERLERLRAVKANLSPLYFLFRDEDGAIRDTIAGRIGAPAALSDGDRMGGSHELLPVTDPDFHARLAALFAQRSLFVADGHHRYEAALAFRNQRRAENADDGAGPAEFVLVMLAAVEDPGVLVLPTHRMLRGLAQADALALPARLRRWFQLRPAEGPLPTGAQNGFVARLTIHGLAQPWDISVYPEHPHEARVAGSRNPRVQALGAATVADILESVLGDNRPDDLEISYSADEDDVLQRVAAGSTQAAFLLPAPDLGEVLAVAERGELLPPKSTWFDPKAPAGLVINELTP